MDNYNELSKSKQYQTPNIVILGYAMQLLSKKEITVRQAMLLGLVDKFCCPISNRFKLFSYRDFQIKYLMEVLRLGHENLSKLIDSLGSHSDIVRMKRLDRFTWRFQTRSKNYREKHGIATKEGSTRLYIGLVEGIGNQTMTGCQAFQRMRRRCDLPADAPCIARHHGGSARSHRVATHDSTRKPLTWAESRVAAFPTRTRSGSDS